MKSIRLFIVTACFAHESLPSQVLQTLSGRSLDVGAILEHRGALSAGAGLWKKHVDGL
jgi:hypothetical protein